MTGPFFSLLQTKIIQLAVLSANYWFYDFDATSLKNLFKEISDNFS